MTTSELIKTLQKLPSDSRVMIAYDTGIRMDVEVAKLASHYESDMHQPEQVVVLTDKYEWADREYWS